MSRWEQQNGQSSRKSRIHDAKELTVGIDDRRHAQNSIFRVVDDRVDG